MPRGRKHKPVAKTPDSAAVTAFMGRIENAAPEWLDGFLERRAVLIERFNERDDEGEYVADAATQLKIHAVLTEAEGNMLKFAALREQHLQSRGLSHFAQGGNSTTTNVLNFAPGMTPEQRAMMERLYLASVSGKEIEAAPIIQIPAAVSDAKAS